MRTRKQILLARLFNSPIGRKLLGVPEIMKQFLRKHKGVLFMVGAFALAKILNIELPPYLLVLSLTDNFDSYNDGDLNGQGGWSGNVIYHIQGGTVQAGTKAISVSDGSNQRIQKTFTAEANGNQIFYVRLGQTNRYNLISVLSGTTGIACIGFTDVGSIYLRDGNYSEKESLGGYSSGTWYKCELEWRVSDKYVRARINDGTWTNWYSSGTTWTTADRVEIGSNLRGDSYWDSFSDPNASKNYTATGAEVFSLTQAYSQVSRFNLALANTFSMSQVMTALNRFSFALSEIFSLSQAFSKLQKFTQILSETISLSQVYSHVSKFTLALSETFSLDASILFIRQFMATLSEIFSLTEAKTILTKFSQAFSEIFNLSEIKSIGTRFSVALSETLSLSQVFSVGSIFFATLSETFNLSQVFSKVSKFYLGLSETIGLSDVASIVFRGWEWISKHATSWTNQAKHLATYIFGIKHSATWANEAKHTTA